MDTTEAPQAIRTRNPTDPRSTDIRVLQALREAGYRDMAQLGRDLGIRQEGVSRILHGETFDKAGRTFRKLAERLGITVDELLGLIESARDNPLYLHYSDVIDYYLDKVDGLTVLRPNRSA